MKNKIKKERERREAVPFKEITTKSYKAQRRKEEETKNKLK